MAERVTDEIQSPHGHLTTSAAWIDKEGRLRQSSGELAVLEQGAKDGAPIDAFLKLIDTVVDAAPGSGERGLRHVAENWGRADAAPIEVVLKSGVRCLLTSHPHSEGGIAYLCIDMGRRLDSVARARELLGDAIESLSEGFALYDEEGRLVLFNEQYREMNKAVEDIIEPGVSWEMLMRTSARRGVYSDAIGREEEWVSERLANGVEFVQELELRHTDGTYYLVSVHPTGIGGFAVTRTDITAMKQAEAIERDSDLLVRKVLDTTSAVVVMARIGDGEVLYSSPAAIELFGSPKVSLGQYLDPMDREDYVTELLADGRVDDFRLDLVNAKGQTFPASMSGRIAEYKGEEVIVSHITDLTEHMEAQALIRKVLEACPVPVQMTNAETGALLFRSPETKALFGETDNARSYYANPRDRSQYIARLKTKGFVDNHKMEFINAKGEKFWGAVSSRLIDFNGEKVIVSNTRDLTGDLAVQDELASQREMLFQNEKMSALGELLAGVAHELNNPLSVVVGHSLMLLEETDDPEIVQRIEKIGRSAERCAKIVKTFLAMARQRPARLEPLDIDALVNTASDVAGFGLNGEAIQISRWIASDIPEIRADPEQITQVILNLIINAEQAMAKSGKGDHIRIDASFNRLRNSLEISVADNGPGISEPLRPRIFEPFFTTKDVGEGTGIGLAFCHRIIHSHGGQIWLDPDYRVGSRFVMALPAGNSADSIVAAMPQGTEDATGASILVVDDEIEVAELIAGILRKDGCSVEHAVSGERALELLAERHFDIMLSDLNMPGIDGRGLFEAVRVRHPYLLGGIAFITGDTMGGASQSLLGEANCPYLEKPVSPAELRGLVQGLLQNRKGARR
jgi:signal transduction histidine kinase/PAS domain-containing protein/ActR/RegA family two-component response regulator